MLDTQKERMDFRSLDRAVESGSFDPKLTPPRLPVYSLAKKPDPLGMTTPPVGPQGAVPFQWEQAPGKPKNEVKPEPKRNHSSSTTTNTRVGLPPKMAAPVAAKEKRFSKAPSHAFSPSSMRDALRQRSASLTSLSSLVRNSSSSLISSFVKGRHSFAKDDDSFLKGSSLGKERKEWREDRGEVKGEDMIISPCYSASSSQSSSSLTFSSCTGGEESEEEREKEETKEVAIKVRITRYERERTIACHTASDFWTKISGRLQAAVPWRRDIKM